MWPDTADEDLTNWLLSGVCWVHALFYSTHQSDRGKRRKGEIRTQGSRLITGLVKERSEHIDFSIGFTVEVKIFPYIQ